MHRNVNESRDTSDGITPQTMAASGVPLALARWYHTVGRHLQQFNDWDIERVMQVRLQVALASTPH